MREAFSLHRIFVALFFLVPVGVVAEDTDIFLVNPGVNSARPNILFVLDNAASNNGNISLLNGTSGKKLEMLRQVLNNIITPRISPYFPDCVVDAVTKVRTPLECVTREEVYDLVKGANIGLMIANASGSGKGGYVRYHIRPMDVSGNRTSLVGKINNSGDGVPVANNAPYAKMMHEAYLYYGGKSSDYVGFDGDEYDSGAKRGDGYNSPITDSCQKNYIIFVGNGGPDSGEEQDTGKLLSGDVGFHSTAVTPSGVISTDPVRFAPNNYASSWFDEYARTLFKRDVGPVAGVQNVVTYTVAVQNPADNDYDTNGMESSRELLKSAAALGGGEAFEAHDGQKVMKIFVELLRKMQAVNTVFSSSTLPVSVNVRGTFLNQVYMGQFRPDADVKPRWPGNLKQYQIALDAAGNPILADRNSAGVEDKDNGFLLADKTSFWTVSKTNGSNYWNFDPMGNPLSGADAPDGAVVEKGGAAQRLRAVFASSQAGRNLYTINGTPSSGTSLTGSLFSKTNNNITPQLLGVTSATTATTDDAARRDLIIDWVRGADNKDNEDGNGVSSDVRARIHGDLVHSRPAVVNYNRYQSIADQKDRDVMIYYGANDGVFHAVKGGQHDDDGLEKWGVVFPEHYAALKRLYDNSPVISVTDPKPYFADGPVAVYQKDIGPSSTAADGKIVSADGDKAYLYIGMRRGGRFAYALDVSDPDTPKYLWKIDSSMPDFSELGQTWSTIRPAKIRALDTGPVVIFGAGYDPVGEDPETAVANTMGRGIYVVNGVTGARIKHIQPAGMGAIPGDLTVVDRNSDGLADRIYAADTKGNVWRVDVDDSDPDNWTSYKLAALSGSGVDARKFLNKPDIVFGDSYDAILVGAGDREHPFDVTIQNRFYMLKDTNTDLTGGLVCGPADARVTCTESHLADVTSVVDQAASLSGDSHGWYLRMATGEKIVGGAVTVFGRTFFATNRPLPSSPGVCSSNLGEARLYALRFDNGGAALDLNADGVIDASDRFEVVEGGGYLPTPVYSPVEIDGKIVEAVCTGAKCFSPGPSKSSSERYRTHWYVEQ